VKLEGKQGFSRQNYLILNVLQTWYQNYFPLIDILTNPIPDSEKHKKQHGKKRHAPGEPEERGTADIQRIGSGQFVEQQPVGAGDGQGQADHRQALLIGIDPLPGWPRRLPQSSQRRHCCRYTDRKKEPKNIYQNR